MKHVTRKSDDVDETLAAGSIMSGFTPTPRAGFEVARAIVHRSHEHPLASLRSENSGQTFIKGGATHDPQQARISSLIDALRYLLVVIERVRGTTRVHPRKRIVIPHTSLKLLRAELAEIEIRHKHCEWDTSAVIELASKLIDTRNETWHGRCRLVQPAVAAKRPHRHVA
jgi:hypothetical protein